MRSFLGSLGATLLVALAVAMWATAAGASTQDAQQFGLHGSAPSPGSPVTGNGTMDTYSYP
jgi:hypothetical protein